MKLISNIKKQFKRFMTGKSGFSLVELIVVIAIMAVMAAVLAPALIGYVERSRAQKDDSAMGEVTNAIQLSLADMDVYDELLPYAVKGNFSCYADGDTSTNIDDNKIITKSPDYWLFTDEARKLDETAYLPAGSMRGATVTFKPNGEAEYILKAGVVNQIGDDSTKKGDNGGAILEDCPELYNRLRSTVGDTIKVSSQTYRNSTYTIFISMGTTGGNQADKQDAIKVYGQYNGTNLPEVMTATGSATQDKGNAGNNQNGGSSEGGNGGIQQSNIIPDGAVYYVGVMDNEKYKYGLMQDEFHNIQDCATETYDGGDAFPEPKTGDIYIQGDYIYCYNYGSEDGMGMFDYSFPRAGESVVNFWTVLVYNANKAEYTPFLTTINNKPVYMRNSGATYGYNDSMSIALPEGLASMGTNFGGCIWTGCPSLTIHFPSTLKNFGFGGDCQNVIVNYNGTLSMWEQVQFDVSLMGEYDITINCTDGQTTLSHHW